MTKVTRFHGCHADAPRKWVPKPRDQCAIPQAPAQKWRPKQHQPEGSDVRQTGSATIEEDQESIASLGTRLASLRSLQLSFAAWAAAAVSDGSDFFTEALEEDRSSHAKREEWECQSTSTLPSLGQSDSLSSEVTGDESVLGPDGDIYEVFYPEASTPEEESVEIEESMGNVLVLLQKQSVALTPVRQRLLSIVTAAAQKILGERLERIAVVGSAALHIDIPASDIDAVAFTRGVCAVTSLQDIAEAVKSQDADLEVQVVTARVPLLVVFDGRMSLDLSIDQSLPEKHVHWFQQLLAPRILPSEQEKQSIEASVLRCVKWWLWQRRLPGTKEGGYPVLAWTLMAMHSQQCSLVVQDSNIDSRNRQVLRAVAAFFDRFAGGRQAGTIQFAESGQSRFCPNKSRAPPCCLWPELAVLDPTAEKRSDLIPKLSEATELLFARELQRAQLLSARLLQGDDGAAALSELFAQKTETANLLPSRFTPGCQGAIFLRGRHLHLVILQGVSPRPGWTASFLHRKDADSMVWGSPCDVESSGRVALRPAGLARFTPAEFVSLAKILVTRVGGVQSLLLQPDDLQCWQEFQQLLLPMAQRKRRQACPPGRVR